MTRMTKQYVAEKMGHDKEYSLHEMAALLEVPVKAASNVCYRMAKLGVIVSTKTEDGVFYKLGKDSAMSKAKKAVKTSEKTKKVRTTKSVRKVKLKVRKAKAPVRATRGRKPKAVQSHASLDSAIEAISTLGARVVELDNKIRRIREILED